ncbi:MAG: hypothetical protein HC945_01470 [Nitrosarchaeum sp.]|nr:hypothetical protein [Nitrosarchaeum sp.]
MADCFRYESMWMVGELAQPFREVLVPAPNPQYHGHRVRVREREVPFFYARLAEHFIVRERAPRRKLSSAVARKQAVRSLYRIARGGGSGDS